MAEPQDLVLPILRELQAELAAFRKESGQRFDKVDARIKNLNAAMAGETVLSRVLVGEYEERLETLEKKVRSLEGRK